MERVEYQQEQMLAELKDLEEKGLFSKSEISIILKRRTAFESALVRRIPKKADFLRYAAYEMNLEALRRRRVDRLQISDTKPSISDFALVRRQFHIFERALRKFKADVGLWVQYIELAKKEGARALVGRISARALLLHPSHPALYIHAAAHEVENGAPGAARTLLQRGLRLNQESVELWREYVSFEVGWVEGMRRRWGVLGVGEGNENLNEEVAGGSGGNLNETDMEDVGEEARKEIMRGAIVKAAIEQAVKALPTMALFRSLCELLKTYPTLLRDSLLSHLDDLLVKTLPTDPAALKLHATRHLPPPDDSGNSFDTVEFIEQLQAANEFLLGLARKHGGAVSNTYAEFVEEWCGVDLEPNLVRCLSTLTALSSTGGRVLAVHVRLLSRGGEVMRGAEMARKYTIKDAGRSNAGLWLARLEAEKLAGMEGVGKTWAEGRNMVSGETEEVLRVWMWGLGYAGDDGNLELLLRESIKMNARWVHRRLLHVYVRGDGPMKIRLARMLAAMNKYLVDGEFFRDAFDYERGREDASREVLEAVYNGWRGVAGEERSASKRWAAWLLEQGDGAGAVNVSRGMRVE
ncbi:U3 small nucleolar RNA-associated protein 6-domain-containing protein [Hysterangium stoloniferum]|nr:U3 small nucleolar RNA-associated protein 6-domain-containing protein [Hysterangium stoloniferum]